MTRFLSVSFVLPPLAVDLPVLLDQVAFQAAGMSIVLGALTGIWIAVAALSRVLRFLRLDEVKPAKNGNPVPTRPVLAAAVATEGSSPLDPSLVAAISAAVHVSLRGRARVVSIVPQAAHSPVWSHEGRRDIYQSHRVR